RALDTRNRQPNGQVLAWLIRRQRSTVLRYQVERGDIFALAHFLSQAERAKAWPCGTWVGGRPLDICADPVDLFLEVVSPVVGQCRDTQASTWQAIYIGQGDISVRCTTSPHQI